MNWKIDDIGIFYYPGWILHGLPVQIIAYGAGYDWRVDPGFKPPEEYTLGWGCDSVWLRPIPPPHEVSQWEEKIFVPAPLVPVTVALNHCDARGISPRLVRSARELLESLQYHQIHIL